MKRALVIAYYFPPVSTSGAMRPLGFCRYLEEFGWLARVVTTEPASIDPPLAIDEGLNARLPTNIRVDCVPHPNRLASLGRTKRRMMTMLGQPARTVARGTESESNGTPANGHRGSLFKARESVLEWLFAFPDPQCAWWRPAMRRVMKLPVGERPDVVFATGGPWTSLVAGHAIARRLQVPLVCDFRDPWTRNPYKSFSSDWARRRAQMLERTICAESARVVVTTPELQKQLAADYPESARKLLTITNGFDTDIIHADAADSRQRIAAGAPGRFELCHFGTVYGNRSPLSLFLAIERLARRGLIDPARFRLRFVGYWELENERCETLAAALEHRGLLRREAPMAHAQCIQEMQRADTLLVLQPGSPLQVPAKIFEYVATGRPIVVIGGEGATASLVERHGLGRCHPDDPIALEEWLLRVVGGRERPQVASDSQLARFHYRSLTAQLAEVLNSACVVPNRMN